MPTSALAVTMMFHAGRHTSVRCEWRLLGDGVVPFGGSVHGSKAKPPGRYQEHQPEGRIGIWREQQYQQHGRGDQEVGRPPAASKGQSSGDRDAERKEACQRGVQVSSCQQWRHEHNERQQ